MKLKLALAAAAALVVSAGVANAAPIVYDFNSTAVGAGNDAYAPGFEQYNNLAGSGAATVSGVTFSGTSGVDDGRFNFPSDGSQTAFLQTFSGLQDGSFSLGASLTNNASYILSFSDVARSSGGAAFTVSQGASTIGTYTPGAAYATTSVLFTSNGSPLTFAVNNASGDHSSAIDNISISAAPEPGVWALMIAGLAMMGGALRLRRRQTGAAVAA